MGNSIPDAAAFLAAAHHRSRHRKKGRRAAVSMPVRIAVVVVALMGLIGASVLMLGLLT